jgi:hypothetical protein
MATLIATGGKLMDISPYAGKPSDRGMLINIPRLVTAYYVNRPDPAEPSQRLAFGTPGHRGSSLDHAFNEAHILAIAQSPEIWRLQIRSTPWRLGHPAPGIYIKSMRKVLRTGFTWRP